jgi:hypothetical protein
MGSKSVVDLIEASSGVHFSGFHMDSLEQGVKEMDLSMSSATENMHRQPFVIGKCLKKYMKISFNFLRGSKGWCMCYLHWNYRKEFL